MTAALATRPPVSSRRVSAGIRPDAGAAARVPCWWGREDWLAEVAEVATADVLREHHIARDTLLAVARAHAAYADHRTGRDCRPTNDRALTSARVSLSTLKRGRRVLRSLGLLVELVAGRSMMTRAERLAAWRRGSSHRQVAAEFALCSLRRPAPRRKPGKVRGGARFHGADLHIVDGGPPPGAMKVSTSAQLPRVTPRRRTSNEDRRSAPRTDPGGSTGAARDLAERARRRVPWLRAASVPRMAPTLSRFAAAGWTDRDVLLAVRDALGALGWRVPARLDHPEAYLARLLRAADPADRPSVTEDAYAAAMAAAAMAAAAATERADRRARVLDLAGRCPHGVDARGAGRPSRGVAPCRECQP